MVRIAFVASFALVFIACGKSSSGGDGGGPETRTTPAAPTEEVPPDLGSPGKEQNSPKRADEPSPERGEPRTETPEANHEFDVSAEIAARCATEWGKLLATQVVGMVKAYERHAWTRSSTERETKRFWRETVTDVSEESFTVQRVDQALLPTPTEERASERVTTREEVLEDCRLSALETSDEKVEVLETRDETLTVKAGTFETTYVKSRQSGQDDGRAYEYLYEAWTLKDRPELIVRAKALWKTTLNDAPFEEESVIELVELVIPEGDEEPQ